MIAIFFLVVFVMLFLFLTNEPAEQPVNGEPLPSTSQEPSGQQAITPLNYVQTKSGSRIQTRDFRSDDGVELLPGEENSYMIGSEEGPNGPLFEIFFFGDYNGEIKVVLLDPDLRFARGRAEEVLQERLGIDGVLELCSYEIQVTTPDFVNPDYSGRNLGISACPAAVQF